MLTYRSLDKAHRFNHAQVHQTFIEQLAIAMEYSDEVTPFETTFTEEEATRILEIVSLTFSTAKPNSSTYACLGQVNKTDLTKLHVQLSFLRAQPALIPLIIRIKIYCETTWLTLLMRTNLKPSLPIIWIPYSKNISAVLL
jgi:hypothetical protein